MGVPQTAHQDVSQHRQSFDEVELLVNEADPATQASTLVL
jgi:hypothetical protein